VGAELWLQVAIWQLLFVVFFCVGSQLVVFCAPFVAVFCALFVAVGEQGGWLVFCLQQAVMWWISGGGENTVASWCVHAAFLMELALRAFSVASHNNKKEVLLRLRLNGDALLLLLFG
jgi:hypothetical protein